MLVCVDVVCVVYVWNMHVVCVLDSMGGGSILK